jgi:MATE family multidrug resistance protein
MTAEPLLALVDTGFISSLGVEPLAALGVGTTALSGLFWIFNFLSIGTQTEVAQVQGKGLPQETRKIVSLGLILAFSFGILLIFLISPAAGWLGELLGASGVVLSYAKEYMQIRLFGAPAVLMMLVTFGAMRGLQDMRTPLWIALGVNALNLVLDWILIFGIGPITAMGVAGLALASTISQWIGAIAGLIILSKTIGLTIALKFKDAKKLLQVGGDLFIRTALINLFLGYITRVANGFSADAGAAHQVIRQVYLFTSLALDAYASTVQSLVGYFIGQDSVKWAKQVVKVGAQWALGTGIVLGAGMWLGRDLITALLVPASAVAVFLPAWGISAMSQPLSGLAFLTDGTHWGTGDYAYLRNAMIVAFVIGATGIFFVSNAEFDGLSWIWAVTGVWIFIRALFGMLRIWPGIGNSIFKNS